MNKVVLIHGFNKNKNDMKTLQSHLSSLNLECTIIDLPLTFKTIEYCASLFEEIFENIISEIQVGEKVSLVGHSSGGLVIRKFLSDTKHITKVHKCILIATPNHGTKLADYASMLPKVYTKIYKTIIALQTTYAQKLQLKETSIEIGAIAGNKNNLFLGKLLQNENDGRVEVSSVYWEGLTDFKILPYGHKEIHYQLETAKLIHKFLISSKFI